MARIELEKELNLQAETEGETLNIRRLRLLLDRAKTQSEWSALTVCKHVRYGVLSYETNRFYYLKDWVHGFISSGYQELFEGDV